VLNVLHLVYPSIMYVLTPDLIFERLDFAGFFQQYYAVMKVISVVPTINCDT